MAQQIINVGSAPNDGTGDVLRVSQQKSNANFTELYETKLENVIPGTNITIDYTNPLSPEISASVGGIQSVVAGTNVTVDNTDPLNPIVSASGGGGGGDEFLLYDKFWKAVGFSLNEWKSAGPTNNSFGNDAFGTYGSATTPTDLKLYATWDLIPSGYIIDGIDLIVLYRNTGSASSIQVYLETGEVNHSDVTDTPSTTAVIVNQTVSIPAGSFLMKFIIPLTVATNSLPTLNEKIVFKAVRELTLANPIYIFGFQYKFKKA